MSGIMESSQYLGSIFQDKSISEGSKSSGMFVVMVMLEKVVPRLLNLRVLVLLLLKLIQYALCRLQWQVIRF